jgi:hypothetical protein
MTVHTFHRIDSIGLRVYFVDIFCRTNWNHLGKKKISFDLAYSWTLVLDSFIQLWLPTDLMQKERNLKLYAHNIFVTLDIYHIFWQHILIDNDKKHSALVKPAGNRYMLLRSPRRTKQEAGVKPPRRTSWNRLACRRSTLMELPISCLSKFQEIKCPLGSGKIRWFSNVFLHFKRQYLTHNWFFYREGVLATAKTSRTTLVKTPILANCPFYNTTFRHKWFFSLF